MSAATLMLDLHRAGFTLSVEGDKLNVDGPIDRLTDATKDAIHENKAGLVRLCSSSPTGELSRQMAKIGMDLDARSDLIEQFHERAGIAEYDGNLPRQQAERIALAEVLADIGRLDSQPLRIQP